VLSLKLKKDILLDVLPFLAGNAIKIAPAAAILPAAWKLIC